MTAFIGKPLSRRDGPAKVMGEATYAAEFQSSGLVHAVLVPAAIASGRASVESGAAEQAPGVLRILTAGNFPRLDLEKVGSPPLGQKLMPLQDDRVLYQGQAIALVIAETLEQAEEAVGLVRAKYEATPPQVFGFGEARLPQGGMSLAPHEEMSGDIDAGLAEADVMVEGEYTLPSRHHNPMEPCATIATWSGSHLTMHTATQWTYGVRYALAPLLGLPPANIRVVCPFTGGGFGCKGWVWPHQIIAAVAAREIGRPLKLVLSRAQMYTETGYQPAMRNSVTLGAKRDGRLTAIRHETINVTSAFEDYIEHGVAGTRGLYAAPNRQFVTKVEPANVGAPTPMRAPHEGPGMFALETAMDELAYAIGLDPVELRLANDTQVDPANGKPFSSRKLRECLMEGAERFGWSRRPMAPRSLRDGHLLIGQGVASAVMTTFRIRQPGDRHWNLDDLPADCGGGTCRRSLADHDASGRHRPSRGEFDGGVRLDDQRRVSRSYRRNSATTAVGRPGPAAARLPTPWPWFRNHRGKGWRACRGRRHESLRSLFGHPDARRDRGDGG